MWNYGVEKTETKSTSTGDKPVICILKPHRGSWSAEYVEATWAPLKHLQVDWCHKISFLCRAPSLPLARNTLVAEGLKSNADYFLWLDADHIPGVIASVTLPRLRPRGDIQYSLGVMGESNRRSLLLSARGSQ